VSFLVDIDADVMAEIRLVTGLPDRDALAAVVGFGRRVLDEQRRGNKIVIVKGDGSMIELTPLSEYGVGR
jgi:hypothetical protein